jgi:hypothetical protein
MATHPLVEEAVAIGVGGEVTTRKVEGLSRLKVGCANFS